MVSLYSVRWSNTIDRILNRLVNDYNNFSYVLDNKNKSNIKRIDATTLDDGFVFMSDKNNMNSKFKDEETFAMLSLSPPKPNQKGIAGHVFVCGFPSKLYKSIFGVLKSDRKTMIRCELQVAELNQKLRDIMKLKKMDTKYIGIGHLGSTHQMSGAVAIATNDQDCKILATLIQLNKVKSTNGNIDYITLFLLRNDPNLCSEIGGNSMSITKYFHQNFGRDIKIPPIKHYPDGYPPNIPHDSKLLQLWQRMKRFFIVLSFVANGYYVWRDHGPDVFRLSLRDIIKFENLEGRELLSLENFGM